MECRGNFFRASTLVTDDDGERAFEARSSFYHKNRDDPNELLFFQLALTAARQVSEFHYREPVDQCNRSSTKLSLTAPNNPTSTNGPLSFPTAQRKLSPTFLRLLLAGILQLLYDTETFLVFREVDSFQRSAALASCKFAKNMRKSKK